MTKINFSNEIKPFYWKVFWLFVAAHVTGVLYSLFEVISTDHHFEWGDLALAFIAGPIFEYMSLFAALVPFLNHFLWGVLQIREHDAAIMFIFGLPVIASLTFGLYLPFVAYLWNRRKLIAGPMIFGWHIAAIIAENRIPLTQS